MDYGKHFSTKKTDQREAIPGREKEMVSNAAGGFVFPVDKWSQLARFITIGTETGTYYVGEKEFTKAACTNVLVCVKEDGPRVVKTIAEISDAGRAPKNDPALFALAMCAGEGNRETQIDAFAALPKVARIGTHLFKFVHYVKGFRGFGPSLRKAIARWYADKPIDDLAYQCIKYQQREGWSHRDLLRLSHPKVPDSHQALMRWIVAGKDGPDNHPERIVRGNDKAGRMDRSYPGVPYLDLPNQVQAFEQLKAADKKQAIVLITECRMPRECVPTALLNEPEIWDALLQEMPMTAMIRNLGKMSAVGLLKPMSAAASKIVERLGDKERIVKARVHPIAILAAMKIYGQGHGDRGKLSWEPVSNIIDALDGAFYKAFDAVIPAGKRTMIGLDVSGSMSQPINGMPYLSAREGACAMGMVLAATEPSVMSVAFTSKGCSGYGGYHWSSSNNACKPISLSGRRRLDDVTSEVSRMPFGGTDVALPILYAMENKLEIDTFISLTDNESWAGDIAPTQALQQYRQKTGIPARMIAVAMTAASYSVADPMDAGQLDVIGFSTDTPAVISEFSKGNV